MPCRAWVVVAALAAASLAAGGCGGGALDSGELHDKVASACAKAHQQLRKVPDPQTMDEVKPFLAGSSQAMTQLADEIKALKPPDDLKQSYGLAVSLVTAQAASLAKGVNQLDRGGDPVVVLRTITDQTTQNSERERAAWDALGIEECANR